MIYYLCAVYIHIKYRNHERSNECGNKQYAQEKFKTGKTLHETSGAGGGDFKAVQTHVDHSDAYAIVTAAGCLLGQILRIVGLGWRSLCNRR